MSSIKLSSCTDVSQQKPSIFSLRSWKDFNLKHLQEVLSLTDINLTGLRKKVITHVFVLIDVKAII